MQPTPLRRSLHLLTAFALVLSQLILLSTSTALAAPAVVVNSSGDLGDVSAGDGVCFTGALLPGLTPECTLRAAIEEANASAVDEISFDIPNSDPGFSGGTWVIEPAAVLPSITQAVSIDASTQPGFGGTPIVILDGSTALTSPGGTDGLLLDTDGATIRGLVIRDYEDDGIEIHGDGNTIVGNHIFGNDSGVLIENGTDNIVGSPSSADRNVISDNRNNGVAVTGGDRSLIRNNYIGVDVTGGSSFANTGSGIAIYGTSTDVEIGAGNVISGNTGAGILVDGAGSTVSIVGNYVGLNAAGTAAIPNGTVGVSVAAAAGTVDIGGGGPGDGNVISGNTGHGVELTFGAGIVTISNNLVGTNPSGTGAIGNGGDGIHADSDAVVIEDNQVSGNAVDGIRVERLDATVRGNLVGTDAAGTGAIPNGDDGIDTGSGTVGTLIGGTGPGDGNVIAFNTDNGIVLRGFAGTTAAILSNSVFGNGGLGIDLNDDGPTPN
ncbi:MAG: right-handed parallel beta-helix repeat-containing protein, partial [Acidimicrobiia bacterium]